MITSQYKNNFNIFIFLLGLALLIKGLIVMKYDYELTPIILFLLLFSTSLVISRFTKITVNQIGICFIAILAILSGSVAPIFIVALIIISAILLGYRICLFLKILEIDYSIQFLLGIGIFGTLIGLGAHWPIAYPSTYSLMLILPFLGIKNTKLYLTKFSIVIENQLKEEKIPSYLIHIFIVCTFIVYFIYSLLPELGYDALVYHLFIPAQMSSRHQWGFDVEKYIWAVFPMLGDWIFSLAYVLSGEAATRFLNLFFIAVGARLIYLLSQELSISKIGQLTCVALYLSSPLTFAMGSTLYVESIWGAYLLAASQLIIRSSGGSLMGPNKNFILIGLMLGFSAAAKMATLVLAPLLLLTIIFFTKITTKKNRAIALISLVLFCIVGSIPNVTAWIKTKNPFFPILNNIFTSPLFPTFKFTPPHTQPINWDMLFSITFDTGKYFESIPGGIGFHLILFLPLILLAALVYGKNEKKFSILLIICIMGILSIFATTSYVRYAYPLFTMLCVCIVASTEIIKPNEKLLQLLRLSLATIIILNLVFLNAAAWNYRTFSFPAIISNEKRISYLLQMNSLRIAVEVVNKLNLNNSPVACFTQPLLAGLNADALIPNWYNEKFQNEILHVKNSADMLQLLKKYKVKYLILQEGAPILDLSKDLKEIIIESSNPVTQIGEYIVIRSARQ